MSELFKGIKKRVSFELDEVTLENLIEKLIIEQTGKPPKNLQIEPKMTTMSGGYGRDGFDLEIFKGLKINYDE